MNEELVQKVVSKQLAVHRWMEEFRQDLEQECRMAYLEAEESFEADRGMRSFDAYAYFKMKHAIQNYMRDQVKHFRKPEGCHSDSSYWDLGQDTEPERIADVATPLDELLQLAHESGLTKLQEEAVHAYVEHGTVRDAADALGLAPNALQERLNWAIKKMQKDLL